MVDFSSVTEITGTPVSKEQLQRMCNRYFWAGELIKNKNVLEVACGVGQGLKYLASIANKVTAGDICESLINKAKENAGEQVEVKVVDAEALPFADNTFDSILLFEAIYYLKDPEQFITECQRVLKPAGQLLIVSANKDLYDFNPSPYSYQYFGIVELKSLLNQHGFETSFYGDSPLKAVSAKQKLLRPIKKLLVSLNLMPKTMKGKILLKRIVFGKPIMMPSAISANTLPYVKPTPLPDNKADKQHKVIFCEARLTNEDRTHVSL